MAHNVTTGQPLTEYPDLPTLFVDWLRGHEDLGSATGEWSRYISTPAGTTIAPAWSNEAWREAWWTDLEPLLPDAKSLSQALKNVEMLGEGRAEVVMTGQQPGAMGGPLYTLYKVASAIEIARWRTEAGRHTVPVFWLGDDDPDLLEAMKSRIYDPDRQIFLTIPDADELPEAMVGDVSAAVWEKGTVGWLEEQPATAMARDLAACWRNAVDDGESLSQLYKRMILRVFSGTGLLIVSGNDSSMHRLAAPLYETILSRLDELKATVADRGEALSAAGWHAQIEGSSLENPLHQVAESGRRYFQGDTVDDAGLLRPGVMLRALVQDWLFQPLAVALGPAELSYHHQILPLYAQLDVVKPAWLPRLFATATTQPITSELADEAANKTMFKSVSFSALSGTEKTLIEFLGANNGMGETEAQAEVTYLLKGLDSRIMSFLNRQQTRLNIEAMKNTDPWVAPHGKRQERVMANIWALALWGDALVQNVKLAAYVHFKRGADGNWLEMIMKVEQLKRESIKE
jgi:uncharacterized protein YllA (UPF0747 family)